MQNPADDESPSLGCQPELPACLIIADIILVWSFINVDSSIDANSQWLFSLLLMQRFWCFILFGPPTKIHVWFPLSVLLVHTRTHAHTHRRRKVQPPMVTYWKNSFITQRRRLDTLMFMLTINQPANKNIIHRKGTMGGPKISCLVRKYPQLCVFCRVEWQ